MILPALATCSRLNGVWAAILANSSNAASASCTPPVKASNCSDRTSIRPAVPTKSPTARPIAIIPAVARFAAVWTSASLLRNEPMPPPSLIVRRERWALFRASSTFFHSLVTTTVPSFHFFVLPCSSFNNAPWRLRAVGVLANWPLRALAVSESFFALEFAA